MNQSPPQHRQLKDLDELLALAEACEREAHSGWGGNRRSPPEQNTISVAAQVAVLTGFSARAVRRKLKIAKHATTEVRQTLAAGLIGENLASQLSSLPAAEQDQYVATITESRQAKSRNRRDAEGEKNDRSVGHRDSKKLRLLNDPDFIDLKEYDYSLDKLMKKYPGEVPDELIAKALMMTSAELESKYQEIVEVLRKKII